VEECVHDLLGIKGEIDQCDVVLAKEKSVNELQIKLRDKKKEESKDYEIAFAATMDLQAKINLKQQELKQLNLKLQNNLELNNKIKCLSELHAQIVNNRANIYREIELYKTISAMYSSTGAQAYILDSVIESFNEKVVDYVSLLWSNMTYELKSYKENVKGDVTAKFSEHLIMDGKFVSIGSLSGGEFRALSLCVDFALIDVMERQFGISLSPIILDEPYDGLDTSGKALITELLETISSRRQVVVVDHSSEISSMFSKVIMVNKKDGISTVSLEA
jgi:DNA repair exonuclease SbcCD ATPase subunit